MLNRLYIRKNAREIYGTDDYDSCGDDDDNDD